MTERYELGPLSEIPEGEGRVFSIGEHKVAVFHARGGGVYATQAECPHRKGPLADGLLGTSTLVCPLHEWKFDLSTGKALNGTCDILTYPIRSEGDKLVLEL